MSHYPLQFYGLVPYPFKKNRAIGTIICPCRADPSIDQSLPASIPQSFVSILACLPFNIGGFDRGFHRCLLPSMDQSFVSFDPLLVRSPLTIYRRSIPGIPSCFLASIHGSILGLLGWFCSCIRYYQFYAIILNNNIIEGFCFHPSINQSLFTCINPFQQQHRILACP